MTKNGPNPSDYVRSVIAKFREKLFPGHGGKKKCAEKFGVNPQLWRDWESGHTIPSAKNQEKLAEFFGITLEELRGISKPTNSPDTEVNHLRKEVDRLNVENESLKNEIQLVKDENKELSGALKHLKDLITNPKTVSDASIPSLRSTRIKSTTQK